MFHHIFSFTIHHSPFLQHVGFTFIRIAFGAIFLAFGYNKLMSGQTNLTQLRSAMGLLGINWGYLAWGYLAALTELCGGMAFILGLGTRIISLSLIFLLIVALKFHFHQNDPFMKWSFACLCLCIVIGYFIGGSGTYSVDHVIQKCWSCQPTLDSEIR